MQRNYQYYKQALRGNQFPLCFLDVDLLKENCKQIKTRISHSKKIRIASKSIRSVEVLKMITDFDKDLFSGIMCFSMAEAVFLSQKGFDNLLVAYPCMQEKLMEELCVEIKKGKTIILMVDCKKHVDAIQAVAKKNNIVVSICLDIDMSTDFPGLHFGVWRSSLFNKNQVLELVAHIQKNNHVRLDGLMGYEAQIAGVGDNAPGQILKNKAIQLLKKISQKEISKRRKEIVEAIQAKGIKLKFVNGGGTGSIEQTCTEEVVTEIAVGSGFYSPSLFDYYNSFKHQAALAFAVEIVRNPKPNVYTCHGGGYIASGSVGKEKLPIPYLPNGIKLFENEGVGEVQTPFIYSGNEKLEMGDPILMRHAKAGEVCERFNEIILIADGKVMGKVPTYRGEGKCFL